jgi:hypothetical protein
MIMKNFRKLSIITLTSVLFFTSCETLDLDLTSNLVFFYFTLMKKTFALLLILTLSNSCSQVKKELTNSLSFLKWY